MISEKGEETDWSAGGIQAVLRASTETNLKFACLVRFIDAGNITRKEILDAVLYLVSFSCLLHSLMRPAADADFPGRSPMTADLPDCTAGRYQISTCSTSCRS